MEVAALHGSAESRRMVAACRDECCVIRLYGIGMGEIDLDRLPACLQHGILHIDEVVPAHMRDVHPAIPWEAPHASGQDSEPRFLSFLTAVEEHLHPEADAEKQPICCDPVRDRFRQSAAPQFTDRIIEATDARQDQAARCGCRQLVRITHDHRLDANPVQSIRHTGDVPARTVHNSDHG